MGKKILYVDDSKTQVMMATMVLAKIECQVVTAGNGQDGFEKAQQEKPDLIILDLTMPVMNGLEALAAIRASEVTRAIPVIMLTTRAEAENIEKAYSLGCNDYVTKPVDGLELIAKVKGFLGA